MSGKPEKKPLPKLFQYKVCPFCWKVKALLSYKKIPYDSVEVHPLNKREIKFSKDYRKVPIFIDTEGRQINDSTPIMRHIDQIYPENPVFAQSAADKKQEDQWLDWADRVLVRALPPLIYKNLEDSLQAFDYITREEKFSWFQQRAVKYSGAIVMIMVAKKSAKQQGITDPVAHLKKCLQDWAKALAGRPFLGGDRPNGADLAVFGILKSVDKLPAQRFIRENAVVNDWFGRIEQVALGKAA